MDISAVELTSPSVVASQAEDKHLSTDHLLADLEVRAVSSGLITVISQGAQLVLNAASIMALARLLDPRDFGLVAMVMTVMGFLQAFRESGLSRATIQREGITHAQVSNLFWINIAVSGAIGLLLAAVSPLIAWFYREPRLIPLTLVLAATFPLSGLAVQHTALLMRRMRFMALAWVQVTAQAVGVGTGIAMAWWGYGYWALVGMQLATGVVTAVLTYLAVPWRPQGPLRGNGTRPLITFGSNLAAGSFVFSIARGFDALAIGRFWGSDVLGLYSRGTALLRRPMEQVMGAAETVLVPMLSRVQNEPDRYRATFLQFYEASALVSCLLTGVMLALARPITLTVLGPNWESAALIFAGFTVSALCAPLTAVSSWLFVSQGRGKGMLLSTWLVSGLFVLSVAIGLPFGPVGVAFATSAMALLIGVPVLFYWAGREGPVRTADLWWGFLRYVPLWAVVCGVSFSMYLFVAGLRPIVQLIISAPTGLLAGAILISASANLRRTALGVVNIVRQLKRPETVRS
jgi:PST family polysaccharide transporter